MLPVAHSLIVRRRFELGVDLLHALHEAVALLLQLAARAVLARVQALAVRRVDGLRRRGPAAPHPLATAPRHRTPPHTYANRFTLRFHFTFSEPQYIYNKSNEFAMFKLSNHHVNVYLNLI